MKIVFIIFSFLINSFLIAQEKYFDQWGMEFIKIPVGDFTIGKFQPTVSRMKFWGSTAPLNEEVLRTAISMANQDARPGFKVQIKQTFYLGKYEVTQSQWKKVMDSNPSYFMSDDKPVDNVTWKMAQRFIKKLNQSGNGKIVYRLPTEFEWEYAARAGMENDISWSDIQASAIIAKVSTSKVGTMKPNNWGLYDMLGNVWEWVQDYYNEKIFADPVPPSRGKQHVLKGASFFGDVKNATYMTHAAGPGSGYDIGLRLVMEFKK
ncbi:MAG: formylglycine-generating enzyme family protein [Saprospiraceae bacterium]